MPVIIDGTNGITQAGEFNSDSSFGFKNRIINGNMSVDQRNAGASLTPSNGQYSLDRWKCWQAASSKFSVQQSTTVPTGFRNSIAVTSLSSYSVGADEYFAVAQLIEGFNVADLNWGTANAKTVTLSFQVRSSLTGTFGGAINNANLTRSYPFSYTISAANTWTTISVTLAGDTTGTWNTDNNGGVYVWFSLGSGANNVGTANTWAGAWYTAPTGSVSVVGTNAATWFVTGVQLEVGSTATSFDYRPYTTELQLCQRYYYRIKAAAAQQIIAISGLNYATNGAIVVVPYPVPLRTAPTALEQSGTAGDYRLSNAAGSSVACTAVPDFSSASIAYGIVNTTVASGIVAGYSNYLFGVNTNAYLGWSAEL
jgi:hypothetical protein